MVIRLTQHTQNYFFIMVLISLLLFKKTICTEQILLTVYIGIGNILMRERERNVLFNDALNTFYLRLYGVRHMVKDHSDSEKGNQLPPHITARVLLYAPSHRQDNT